MTDQHKTDMLSIQLSQSSGSSEYKVDSVDISQPNFRHRMTFSKSNESSKVLAPKLADYVETLLGQVHEDSLVHSEPDTVVDLPGLVLGRLRMLVHVGRSFRRHVIIRFAYFIGGVQSAFRLDTHFRLPTVTHGEALAIAALHDICIPVFDIVSSSISGLLDDKQSQERMETRVGSLTEIQSDLLFYLELLKRYIIASSQPEFIGRPENVLQIAEFRASKLEPAAG